MRTLKVEIEGKTDSDLVYALEEVLRLVQEGYVRGSDRNDDGNYSFETSGGEEPSRTMKRQQRHE